MQYTIDLIGFWTPPIIAIPSNTIPEVNAVGPTTRVIRHEEAVMALDAFAKAGNNNNAPTRMEIFFARDLLFIE